MKKFILYSTLVGIFSEAAIYKIGVDIKLLYIIVLINFFLISNVKKISVPKFQVYTIIYLIFSAILGILNNTNDFRHAIEQILGINILGLYFYNFFLLFRGKVKDIFNTYLIFVYYLSIIGILIFAYQIAIGNFEFRLYSLLLEPAHYAGAVIPAFYYLLKNFSINKKKFFTVASSLVFAGSSIGFIGILVAFFLFNKKIFLIKNVLVYSLAVLIAFFVYINVDNVKMRVDDTLNSSGSLDVSGANWSTYALISNTYITYNVLVDNIVFGHGIGSHELSHKRYIDKLVGVEEFSLIPDLNAKDANSLFLRILSDLGLLGGLVVISLIVKYYTNSNDFYVISRAIFIYFFYKLFREGHYFSPEMYFFVLMYYFNFIESKSKNIYEKNH